MGCCAMEKRMYVLKLIIKRKKSNDLNIQKEWGASILLSEFKAASPESSLVCNELGIANLNIMF
jgi:hypothetical protein